MKKIMKKISGFIPAIGAFMTIRRIWTIGVVALALSGGLWGWYSFKAGLVEKGYLQCQNEVQSAIIKKQKEIENVKNISAQKTRHCINLRGVYDCMRENAGD